MDARPERVTFEMTADSWLVRRLVAPTYFYFDPASHKVQGYDGRVPPMEELDRKLRTLDARVSYVHHSTKFR